MNRELAARFPLLTQFARGYLHEDGAAEYPSALTALRAYLRELSPDEQLRLGKEMQRFGEGRTTLAEWNNGLSGLGAAYELSNETELQAFRHLPESSVR